MSSVGFVFQNKRFLLHGNTSDMTPGDHYFHDIFLNIYLAFSFLCHLHHIFDSYVYIIAF